MNVLKVNTAGLVGINWENVGKILTSLGFESLSEGTVLEFIFSGDLEDLPNAVKEATILFLGLGIQGNKFDF